MADRPVVIGLTGGIGSGKSTCANIARAKGLPVFDCDDAIAAAYTDAEFMRGFRKAFGSPVSVTDAHACELARTNPSFRRQVAPLLQDFVVQTLKAFVASRIAERAVIVDAPLLFEWEMDDLCDFTICLVASEAERLRRVLARSEPAMTEADFRDVIDHQTSDTVRVFRASEVVDGNGSVEAMSVAFLQVLDQFVPAHDAGRT